MRQLHILLMLLCFTMAATAQDGGNLRSRSVKVDSDTIALDTLSIIPDSFHLLAADGSAVPDSLYSLEWFSGMLIAKQGLVGQTLTANYRVFSILFSQRTFNKDPSLIQTKVNEPINPFTYTVKKRSMDELFDLGTLTKSGSISRGIQVGNNQDLGVTSSLNLNLTGQITPQIGIRAVITDNNIPFQPEGNTQQLQDFDQIYIQLFTDRTELTAGDFRIDRPPSYFMNFLKRAQGLRIKHRFDIRKQRVTDPHPGFFEVDGSGALSKGKFSRQIFPGKEGVQGPYLLRGAENEPFIIIIAGTEMVYIDGKLLTRGQENDYIINYNTAEITFTSKRMISKDSRIVVEFQYSERNYSRSLFHAGLNYEKHKVKVRFNLYSEQDSKNPVSNININEDQYRLLDSIGDNLDLAILPASDSVGYTNDQVRYRRTDTTVTVMGVPAIFQEIFVQSFDPATAYYQVVFSDVGLGNGDYEQVPSSANGRVYQWVPPDSLTGARQGRYLPIQKLITPKQSQLFTLGAEYLVGKNGKATMEGALSNTDLNRFSSVDNEDNLGYGMKVRYDHRIPLDGKGDSAKWALKTSVDFEHVSETFRPIERYRTVEFERDWNLQPLAKPVAQYISSGTVGVVRREVGELAYTFRSFINQGVFNANQHAVESKVTHKGFNMQFNGSYITSDGEVTDNRFGRFILDLEQKFKWFVIGGQNQFEDNRFRASGTDSLLATSYMWNDAKIYVKSPATWKNSYSLFYQRRDDMLPKLNELAYSSVGESFGLSGVLGKNPNSVLKGTITYRRLQIKDSELSDQPPDNTLINRLEYYLSVLKGAITSNTFYEVGSGLESKKDYTFVEVVSGQGAWNWIDQNGNGVKEITEFVEATFIDTAKYIRVFIPTDEYIKVYTTQFSEAININPRVLWANKKGMLKFLSRLSDQFVYSMDRRIQRTDLLQAFDPFFTQVADTSLVTLTSSFRNTFFFNRSSSKVGGDYTFQDTRTKTSLANGFETRTRTSHNLKSRWNITKSFTFNMEYEPGKKTAISDFINSNNYEIDYYFLEPQLVYQLGTKFRVRGSFRYTERLNSLAEGPGQGAYLRDAGIEAKYNILQRGSVNASFNFISISYNGPEGTTVEFEMLDGLKNGANFTWAVLFQTKLGKNMQLNLQYNGRKSGENDAIHTGNVQVRAFF
ncbi:MAG: hypothetical protein K9J06_00020 [Flavobacteriales bacterium]|nr:hypothetical protein [Flavobacteriales bacterium]